MWHPFVTCDHCGYVHECARLIATPCTFSLCCHGCERPLTVTITREQIDRRRTDDQIEKHLGIQGLATVRRAQLTDQHGVG